MPHVIVEFARELASDAQVMAMVDAVHRAVVASGLFEIDHVKTRAIPLMFYRCGTGSDPFMHAQLRIHAGRTDVQKKALSDAVLAALCAQGWPAKVVTVEVVEMNRASYAKYPG